jgi:TonB family protein
MVLKTGPLGKAIAMFDECERDLLKQWGVDPAIQDQIVKPVWSQSPLGWFTSDDYPSSALARNEESTVNVRLAVDSSGKVTKCASLSAYAAPDFNKVVCNVYLTRARFAPAELADGTKVASYYSQNITFKIPSH